MAGAVRVRGTWWAVSCGAALGGEQSQAEEAERPPESLSESAWEASRGRREQGAAAASHKGVGGSASRRGLVVHRPWRGRAGAASGRRRARRRAGPSLAGRAAAHPGESWPGVPKSEVS